MKSGEGRTVERSIDGVIFDLDGVIVTTDEYHFQAWKRVAEDECIFFDRRINERLRGVSRMNSLEIILERAHREYNSKEKEELADRKNCYYKEYIKQLSAKNILPGVAFLLDRLKEEGISIAIGSSSKNCTAILGKIGLGNYFDAVVSGNDIKKSKPDPEVFLLAASRLGLPPDRCLVVEDAEAGVTAAIAGGMKVLAVGSASNDRRASMCAKDLSLVKAEQVMNISKDWTSNYRLKKYFFKRKGVFNA